MYYIRQEPEIGLPGSWSWRRVCQGPGAEPIMPKINVVPQFGQKRYVVLDRDGTVIVERHYLSDPDQVELIPGAAKAMSQLQRMNLGLIIVTNQSGIGRGFFDRPRVDLVHERLSCLLEAEDVRLDGIFTCPHTPEDDCRCRKPKPLLMESAAEELGFDPKACFVIGDKASDIEFGKNVGATTFLVSTGYGAQVARNGTTNPDNAVGGLLEAAQLIQGMLEQAKRA